MFNFRRLQEAFHSVGGTLPGTLFAELSDAYGQPDRFYHNATHITECLGHLDQFRHLAVHPGELELAIWFHDAVYDPHRGDNEEKSADWARQALAAAGINGERVQRVAAMILATKSHQAADPDTKLLLDIDLAVLGAATERFERYDADIRLEYSWVAAPDYCAGRAKVLESFLNRAAIYSTPDFHHRYESCARENLTQKIASLRSAFVP